MKIFKDIFEWKKFRNQLPADKTVGVVMTMGALHEGHCSLIRRSLSENDYTVATIFLNPKQFNSSKDLQCYPKTWEDDLRALEALDVDFLLAPEYSQIYPDDYKYKISENEFSNILCGASRPGHFDGVLTIVMKLLNIVKADKTYFGEKDYQQYLLIKKMAEAFFLDVEVIGCDIIRETDNLALSSRNMRLTENGRKSAAVYANLIRADKPLEEIKSDLESKGINVDYLEEHFGRRFAAVFIDEIRLIDNFDLKDTK